MLLCVSRQYDPESAPALALKATMDRTEKRFANYAKAGLLCGADGLPHLISDPGLALKYGHAGEVFVSTRCTLGGRDNGGLRVVGSSSRAPARQQGQGCSNSSDCSDVHSSCAGADHVGTWRP